jgi:hypothetical protein
MGSINEFLELVGALYQLGQEVPHYLLFLSELAEPTLSQDMRTPILGRLFEEVPNLLSNVTAMEFHKLIVNVPQDAVTLRMLVNLYKISTLFQQMSCLQILHLTNHLIPPGPLAMQAEILTTAQEHMRGWNNERMGMLHEEMGKVSLQLERKRLLELEPTLPWELLQFFMEVLKLPLHELSDFSFWFVPLPTEKVHVLVQILQLEPIIIMEFKRRLTLPSTPIHTKPLYTQPSPPIHSTHTPTMQQPTSPIDVIPSPLGGVEAFMEEIQPPLPVFDTDSFTANILFVFVYLLLR